MMLEIPQVLNAEQVRHCRQRLQAARWSDGKSTAGHGARSAKDNLQLPADSREGVELGQMILDAIGQNALFVAATLPLKVLPPMFNCYQGGGTYGNHVDNAIRVLGGGAPGGSQHLRADISCTLFLSDPDEYEGGDLTVQDTYGTHTARLPAGHALVYPSSSLHRVTPVTRGARLAAVFWIQSFVRSDERRSTLLELDSAIQHLMQKLPDDPALVQLTGVYHNLLRQWAEM